jgi:hypothetical protein
MNAHPPSGHRNHRFLDLQDGLPLGKESQSPGVAAVSGIIPTWLLSNGRGIQISGRLFTGHLSRAPRGPHPRQAGQMHSSWSRWRCSDSVRCHSCGTLHQRWPKTLREEKHAGRLHGSGCGLGSCHAGGVRSRSCSRAQSRESARTACTADLGGVIRGGGTSKGRWCLLRLSVQTCAALAGNRPAKSRFLL